MIDGHRFEPARFSDAELSFMLDQLEKPAHAALHRDIPRGVNPIAIESALDAFYRLDQLHKFEGVAWQGYDAVRESILSFLGWREQCERIKRLGGPSHPSMFVWDGSQHYKYGIGADSGEMTRTKIEADGSRVSFGLDLQMPAGQAILGDATSEMPWVQARKDELSKVADEVVDKKIGTNGSLTCSICGEAQSYQSASRASFSGARARMGKHLQRAKSDIARHRRLHQRMYTSGRTVSSR